MVDITEDTNDELASELRSVHIFYRFSQKPSDSEQSDSVLP